MTSLKEKYVQKRVFEHTFGCKKIKTPVLGVFFKV
jgi:hypothetical protein